VSAELLDSLRARVKAIPPADAGHDFSHILRVSTLTLDLFSQEVFTRFHRNSSNSEKWACLCAALLHDCVPIAKDSPLRKKSARLASEKAREWLTELKWPEQVSEICEAIEDHSYSASLASGRAPRSLLGECLQDADRLEALGAIGLYRTIATGVSMGAQLFHPEDPWAENRELDDKKYSIDHFFTKLLKLPETFRTRAAKNEATKRADYLRAFVVQLKYELKSTPFGL